MIFFLDGFWHSFWHDDKVLWNQMMLMNVSNVTLETSETNGIRNVRKIIINQTILLVAIGKRIRITAELPRSST